MQQKDCSMAKVLCSCNRHQERVHYGDLGGPGDPGEIICASLAENRLILCDPTGEMTKAHAWFDDLMQELSLPFPMHPSRLVPPPLNPASRPNQAPALTLTSTFSSPSSSSSPAASACCCCCWHSLRIAWYTALVCRENGMTHWQHRAASVKRI